MSQKFKLTGYDGVEKMFDSLASGGIALKAVKEAAPILNKSAKKAVHSAANKGYATGDLEDSFVQTDAKENKYGAYSVIRPVGKDSKGVYFNAIATFLEFGTPNRTPTQMEASPWREKAVNGARTEVESKMESVVNSEVSRRSG